jgi:hypothetical protein
MGVMTFEQFLEYDFINHQFVGHDDQIPDAVDAYMENLEVEPLMKLAQQYGDYRSREAA